MRRIREENYICIFIALHHNSFIIIHFDFDRERSIGM